jgi:hypothetical protein
VKARRETGPAAVGEGSPGSDRRVSSGDGGYRLDRETGGLAALLVVSIGLALGLLYWSARAQDDILIRDSRHLADTALRIQAATLESILTDYSYWDDAYANISENLNLDWFYETFGDYPYLTDYFGIASSFVIAPGNRIVAYTLNGERGDDVRRPDLDQAAGFLALIEAARRKVDGEFQEISAFVRMEGQLYIAAARMVLPYSRAPVDVTPQNGMVAVVMRPVDDAFLAALSAGLRPHRPRLCTGRSRPWRSVRAARRYRRGNARLPYLAHRVAQQPHLCRRTARLACGRRRHRTARLAPLADHSPRPANAVRRHA